jgi:ATP-dependent helicase IRC3
MEQCEKVILEIKQKINARKKPVYMKFKTLLSQCGYKRRNRNILDSIDTYLDKFKLEVYSNQQDEGWDWYQLSYDEMITFKIIGDEPMPSDTKVSVDYVGTIHVNKNVNPKNLYIHQSEALKRLDEKLLKKTDFSGLLVLPTGGGKTLTAVQWLLRNVINENKKVLWIAHRHELLEQAFQTIKENSYANLLNKRDSFRYRIISGMHDRPVNTREDDDFIIASKDSLNRGINYLVEQWLKNNENEVFLAVDEAHHATAKTYRKLIEHVKNNVQSLKMLGLTATPFRTSESEKGLLKKIFTDDIVYKVDLETLINRGILAKPIFEELNTELDLYNELTEQDIKNIHAFDSIPQQIAREIAESKERNNKIVNHYVNNREKYGQTLVFAIDIHNAISLNALFKKRGISSEFVTSSIKDMATGVTISNEENKEKIEKFRMGHVNVLININILTEGTDLPNTQTVFLTRPTISSILMTQMIGRALRGVKAGGTETAYIVSFIDNWKDKITWVNPEKLFIEESGVFNDDSREAAKQLMRLISIKKIEEFARIADESINTEEIEALPFIQRVPIGLYSFSIFIPTGNGDDIEKHCEVLVFNHLKGAYEDFINDLDLLFDEWNLQGKEYLADKELDNLCLFVKREHFDGYDMLPNYREQDIKDILSYYALKSSEPVFLPFDDRERCNLTEVAKHIFDNSLGGIAKVDYIDSVWDAEQSFWKVFFGYNKLYFRKQLDIELLKIEEPGLYSNTNTGRVNVEHDIVDIEKLSLSEMRKKHPRYWRELSIQVYEKAKDKGGYYTCAISGFKSKSKLHFQIDHITPISKGGLSKLDNLQLLKIKINQQKGDKEIVH